MRRESLCRQKVRDEAWSFAIPDKLRPTRTCPRPDWMFPFQLSKRIVSRQRISAERISRVTGERDLSIRLIALEY